MTKLTESHVIGRTDEPLKYQTIGSALDEITVRFDHLEALVVRHQDIRWTYGELHCEVNALAAGFLAIGLEPGDRIGIWSQNRAEWVVTQFATAKVGLILVNINPAYRLSELEYALNKASCKALLISPEFKSSNYTGMAQELMPEIASQEPGRCQAARVPELRSVIRMGDDLVRGMYRYDDIAGLAKLTHAKQVDQIATTLKPDDAINIQFTSGTTGFPKGATLSHFNILNNGFFVGQAMGFTESDRLCIPVPLYHCFGMVLGNLASVTHGATMVYPGEGFDPKEVLDAVVAESCTALHGVPTMFIAMLDDPSFADRDFSTLRTGIMAGSPCPVEVMKQVVSEMNMAQVTIAYGMTETSPVSFQSSIDDLLERRVSTVGRIHPHVEVKIVDEHGKTVPPDTKGEILTRGYSVMCGYWGDDKMTGEAIDGGGWMHTGDLGVLDADGYCNIVGRVKDMVIRGGENIYPREVEEYLYRHQKIQDVQVFGVPDDRFGEELCAWIKLRSGESADEEEIRDFCKGQIAHFKIPRYIRFVDEFPMTVTGKVQKFIMREKMIEKLILSAAETA